MGALTQAGRWLAPILIIGLVSAALLLRPFSDSASSDAPPTASVSPEISVGPSPHVEEPITGWIDQVDRSYAPELTPGPARSRTPAPTATPTPTPAPPLQTALPSPMPTAAPVAAAPTDDGSGGPIGPLRTPPPGWVPPTTTPGDVIVESRIGQQASAGGITVSVTRITAATEGQRSCESGYVGDAGTPDGYEWTGFLATTRWSGFSLEWPGGSSVDELWPACYHGGYPFSSGVTYEVWLAVPVGTGPSAMLQLGYFPNSSSPAYIFRFR